MFIVQCAKWVQNRNNKWYLEALHKGQAIKAYANSNKLSENGYLCPLNPNSQYTASISQSKNGTYFVDDFVPSDIPVDGSKIKVSLEQKKQSAEEHICVTSTETKKPVIFFIKNTFIKDNLFILQKIPFFHISLDGRLGRIHLNSVDLGLPETIESIDFKPSEFLEKNGKEYYAGKIDLKYPPISMPARLYKKPLFDVGISSLDNAAQLSVNASLNKFEGFYFIESINFKEPEGPCQVSIISYKKSIDDKKYIANALLSPGITISIPLTEKATNLIELLDSKKIPVQINRSISQGRISYRFLQFCLPESPFNCKAHLIDINTSEKEEITYIFKAWVDDAYAFLVTIDGWSLEKTGFGFEGKVDQEFLLPMLLVSGRYLNFSESISSPYRGKIEFINQSKYRWHEFFLFKTEVHDVPIRIPFLEIIKNGIFDLKKGTAFNAELEIEKGERGLVYWKINRLDPRPQDKLKNQYYVAKSIDKWNAFKQIKKNDYLLKLTRDTKDYFFKNHCLFAVSVDKEVNLLAVVSKHLLVSLGIKSLAIGEKLNCRFEIDQTELFSSAPIPLLTAKNIVPPQNHQIADQDERVKWQFELVHIKDKRKKDILGNECKEYVFKCLSEESDDNDGITYVDWRRQLFDIPSPQDYVFDALVILKGGRVLISEIIGASIKCDPS